MAYERYMSLKHFGRRCIHFRNLVIINVLLFCTDAAARNEIRRSQSILVAFHLFNNN